jgi:L-threonylcarbamoyladenylate synthase
MILMHDRISFHHDILDEKNRPLLNEIASRISQGAICIYPTETIYGIGGRYDNSVVFQKILDAKGRSPNQPMILLGATIESFAPMRLHLPKVAQKLADAFWPGLLTMILPSPTKPEGVAIRVSNHPFVMALSDFIDRPLFSTSANVTGVPYNPDPDIIYQALGNQVDFMIDIGMLPPSLPSTVIRIVSHNEVSVVREGCIPSEKIFAIVNG